MIHCKSPWWLLNIQQFFKDNEIHSCYNENNVQIKFSHIPQLLAVISKIDDHYPALNKAVPCLIDHVDQESYKACSNCNLDQLKNI